MLRVRWSLVIFALLVSGCAAGPNPTPSPPADTLPAETQPDSGKTAGADPTPPAADSGEAKGQANADVTFVRAVREDAEHTWTFQVTVEHPDTGWEDYADGWDVVLPDGTVVKPDPEDPFTRLLLHPHVDEQPFTRSQRGIVIPEDVETVRVRAHDLVDGWGGQEVTVDLTEDAGEHFEVVR